MVGSTENMREYQGSFTSGSAAAGLPELHVAVPLFGVCPGALVLLSLAQIRGSSGLLHLPPQPLQARSKVRLGWVPDLGGMVTPGKLTVGFMKVEYPCNCQLPAKRMGNDW